jgi:hypothetical protein
MIISLGRAAGGKRVRGRVKLGWSRLGRAALGQAAGKGQGPQRASGVLCASGVFCASGVYRQLPMACTVPVLYVQYNNKPCGSGQELLAFDEPSLAPGPRRGAETLARTPLSHARRLRAGALPILGMLILQHDRRPCFASLILRTVLYFKCWGLG